ncbi:MAG: hypothetical protein KAJ10_05350 [Thermodesulfovibrionia bacterium]|nr:hypothetical protein [Thermodesulfovibrionia bacterium]
MVNTNKKKSFWAQYQDGELTAMSAKEKREFREAHARNTGEALQKLEQLRKDSIVLGRLRFRGYI